METPIIRFAGETFEPLVSGALFWRAQATLIAADLHLEKMSSFARRGSFLPPYDTTLTLKRLAADIAATGARAVIALGDSFHRDYGTASLSDDDRLRLDALTETVDWVWLAGNHDPKPHGLGGDCLSEIELGTIRFAHHPKRGAEGLVSGHLHPAAHVAINGRSVRRPCFVHDTRQMILPAYGSSTGSINILGPAFAGHLQLSRLEVTMIGRDRLYPVSPRRLIA